jgi:hypothetical protein
MLVPLRQGLPPIDLASVSSSASCALPARFEAVGGARKFTRSTLCQWDLESRFDDVALVVSELVTNALRHASPGPPPCPAGTDPAADVPRRSDAPVRLHLMHWSSRLVCAVRDPSHDGPSVRESDDLSAESGRGLFLVEAFSDNWGWHPLAGTLHGKVVWALFRLQNEQ